MKMYLLAVATGFLCVAATIVPSRAATLDDVMARLDALQRDNQAMRREIAALRQKEARATAPHAVDARNATSRKLATNGPLAMATGIPVKARSYVEPPQAFSWSGFYMGVHGGYGWGSSNWNLTSTNPPLPFAGTASPSASGLLGGIQGGANYQLGNWVTGIEGDLSLIDSDATSVTTISPGITESVHSQTDWLATFTGRFGYAFDHSLLYVKGGVAGAEFENSNTISAAGGAFSSATQSNTRLGWTAGGGFEYAFLNNWSAKVEYDYLDFGAKDETFVVVLPATSAAINQSVEHKLQLVKVGINYRFGGDSR